MNVPYLGGAVSYKRGTPVDSPDCEPALGGEHERPVPGLGFRLWGVFSFFFTLVTGPGRSLSLKLSDRKQGVGFRVYGPWKIVDLP